MKKSMYTVLIVIFLVMCSLSCVYGRDKACIISIDTQIDEAMSHYVKRSIEKAEKEGCSTVVLEINTSGGLVESAEKIKDSVLKTRLHTIAYVKDRAWSAGALIALSCKEIVMSPGSTIGAAEPRIGGAPADEKIVSALRADFAAVAELRNRPVEIVKSMVDKDIAIPNVNDKGKLLTLTVNEAIKLGVADRLCNTLDEVLAPHRLDAAKAEKQTQTWAEILSRILTNPVLATILLILGLVGLLHELVAPGHGIGAAVSLLFLGLFFGGHYLAGAGNWFALLVFVIGVVLLIAEIFFIPGTGIAFVLSVICLGAGVILSFDNINTGIWVFAIALMVTTIITYFSFKYIMKTSFWKERIVLNPEYKDEKGYKAGTRDYTEFMGKVGLTLTPLRPVGRAQFDEEKIEVVSEGEFVEKDVKVEVIQIEGNRVVVRESSGK